LPRRRDSAKTQESPLPQQKPPNQKIKSNITEKYTNTEYEKGMIQIKNPCRAQGPQNKKSSI